MYDFLSTLTNIQGWFVLACSALSALAFPFLPTFVVHSIYRKWIRFSRFKWLRIIFICFMLAFAICGMFFILWEYQEYSEKFVSRFLTTLGINN